MSKRVRTSLRASNKGRSLRPKAVIGRRSLLPGEAPSLPLNDAAPPSVPERLTVPEVPAARHSAEAPVPEEARAFTPEATDAREATQAARPADDEAEADPSESQAAHPMAE